MDQQDHQHSKNTNWHLPAVILILAIGAWLRFSGLNWDSGTHLHPDERFLTQVESAIEPTFSIKTYFSTATSPLSPYNRGYGFFVYGTLPIFIVRYVAEGLNAICQSSAGCTLHFIGYDGVHLVGRALSALADLSTVLVLLAIGWRLYGRRVGVLAALLWAAAVLPIQQAHYFTVDTFVTLFAAIAFYFAIRVAQDGARRYWVFFGVSLGLAVACKIAVWPMGLVLVVAALVRLARNRNMTLTQAFVGLALAALVAVGAFRVAQPYAFAGPNYTPETVSPDRFNAAIVAAPEWWAKMYDVMPEPLKALVLPSPEWLGNMRSIRGQMTGDVDFPPNHQWTDRQPIVFPWRNMVLYGMGPLLGLAAWLGWALAVGKMARPLLDRGRTRIATSCWQRHLMPVLWITVFFLYQGTQWVKSMRYLLPIYPTLILMAAWLLVSGWDWARQRRRGWQVAMLALAIGVVATTYAWAIGFTTIYREPMTRVAAARWIYDNVPTGATLIYRTADGDRELQVPITRFEYAQDGSRNVTRFQMPADGTALAVRMNHLSDPLLDEELEAFRVALASDVGGVGELATAIQTLDLRPVQNVRGDAVLFDLSPVTLHGGQEYYLITEALSGAPIKTTGAYVVNETSWDDPLPVRMDGLDGFSIYEGEPLELYWEDTGLDPSAANESKLERMLRMLDQGEYLFISSTRQLGSITRLPPRYPLTIAYYQALFDGRLGYELVETFMGDIHVGPLVINDVFGKLGWGEAPEVGWPPPGDLAAEEAFSVYDHPPVWVFKKQVDYAPSQVRAELASVDLSQRRFLTPYQYTEELKAKRRPWWLAWLLPAETASAGNSPESEKSMFLAPDELAEQRAGGTWREMFDPGGWLSARPALGAAVWWLLLVLLGWFAFPLAFVALNGLPSKGYVVSKILALLLVAWFSWLAASLKLLPYTRGTIWLSIALLAVVGLALGWWRRRELVSYVKQNWRWMLLAEGAALALFIISLLIRSGNPDLWHPSFGGEKPMDFAFLNAVLKSSSFPPYDPWLAGGYINYYYFGFVLIGSLIKALGIIPVVAYNIALPMLFALTGMGAFSISFDLIGGPGERSGRPGWVRKAVIAGLVAAILIVLLGNLGQVWTIVNGWYKLGGPADNSLAQVVRGAWLNLTGQRIPIYPGSWYWDATRLIPPAAGEAGPISEFPFFTFLYADLHAHMMDMPLVLLALAWSLGLAQLVERRREQGPAGFGLVSLIGLLISLPVGALAIGALRATNTWDWPAMLGVAAVAILYASWRRVDRGWWWLLVAGAAMAALALISNLLFKPYIDNFVPAYTEVKRWQGGITPVWAYFGVHGLFLFLLVTLLGREFADWTRNLADRTLVALEPWGCLLGLGVLAFLGLMVASLLLGVPVGPFILLMMVPAGLLALQRRLPAERRAVLMLFTLGLAMTLAVEFVVLSGDISRMNTVFKFYMQVWLIFSAIGGAALVMNWDSIRRWRPGPRNVWLTLFGLLVFAAALYPPTAAWAKINDRFQADLPPAGLNGMAYMRDAVYYDKGQPLQLAHDYNAIRWLQDHVDGSPVVMEGNAPNYHWGNRISIYTGLPTVVGWDWHTRQHRAGFADADQQVRRRVNDVNDFYNTSDTARAMDILRTYDVKYVIVGPMERAYYGAAGIEKFDLMVSQGLLTEAYRHQEAVIYQLELVD